MKKLSAALATLIMSATGYANAALFHFTGDIEFHNDVVYTYFTVNSDATDVRVWTDSFLSGINFDPITALWTADGQLINQSDDNASINPATQSYYDSGFFLPTLGAGNYIFTVATYNNFAQGDHLTEGFEFDNEAPIAMSEWNQPASTFNMGTQWSVWLDGVDQASNPSVPSTSVPEPSPLALLGLALLAFGLKRLKRA